MVPPPYGIQVMCGWADILLDGGFGIRDAQLESVEERLDISLHGIVKDTSATPYWTDLQVAVHKMYFKVYNTLCAFR